MKYFFLLLTFLIGFFSFAQNEKPTIIEKEFEKSYELNITYKISPDDYNSISEDLNKLVGEPLALNYWSTPKTHDKIIMVKIVNDYLFFKSYDYTENQDFKPQILKLKQRLAKYSKQD